MPRSETQLLAFNRGLISPLGLARVDLKRYAYSAEQMVNWQPRSLGSMMLRPGTEYLGSTHSNAAARFVNFVFSADFTALLEFTDSVLRVWHNDALITRAAVSTQVLNTDFAVNLNNWTDNDETGAASIWVTNGAGGGYMQLLGNGTAAAIRDQQVTVALADTTIEHALRITIVNGPVTILIGTSSGGSELIGATKLITGTHSLTFTPNAASFWIRFISSLDRIVLVAACFIEASGIFGMPSPYLAADLQNIRGDADTTQSGNIIYFGCSGYQQREVIRYSDNGWGIGLYQPEDGPFRTINTTSTTIEASAISGNITLLASRSIFDSRMAGSLLQLTSSSQTVSTTAAAQNVFTDSIRVVGVGLSRSIAVTITGLTATGSAVTLQRSPDAPGAGTDVLNYVADTTSSYTDGLDNQIYYYRLGIKPASYLAGTIVMTLEISTGSITGVVRLTVITGATSADAEVMTHLGSTDPVDTWSEGAWSDYRGWPTAGAFLEARLCWAGQTKTYLSTTDLYDVFSTENEDGTSVGDSGPISRSIGSGPVENINWVLPLNRLILGGQMAEFSCRSSAFDEPLTPTNFNIKVCSTQGCSSVQAVKLDQRGVFVQRGGTRIFELNFDGNIYDYTSIDMTTFYPEAGGEADSDTYIKRIAVQRQPDTRIHCIRSDGVAAVLVNDKAENVLCWVTHETDGTYEDVVVLPSVSGNREDQVYYVVNRTINGATMRFLEKWAYESECQGGTFNKQADSFAAATQAASTTINGLNHLAGKSVVCWHDGICETDLDGNILTYTVSSTGSITLDSNASDFVVGLPYEAQFKGTKLGTALGKYKHIDHLAIILYNTHPLGLLYGPTFDADAMEQIAQNEDGAALDQDVILDQFDQRPMVFQGTWSTDARVCLQAAAPRPCTVLAIVVQGEVH